MINYLVLFLLIFDIAIPGIPGMTSSLVSLIICLVYMLLGKKHTIRNRDVFSFFSNVVYLYVFIFCWVFISVSFSPDMSYLLSTLKASVILLSTICYLSMFYDDKLFDRLINVFFINALICFIGGSYLPFKELLSPFRYGGELIGFNPYRDAFLSGSGYFGISSVYAFAFCCFLYLYSQTGIKVKYFSLKLFSILLAGILAGRIAIPISLLAFTYLALVKQKISYLISGIFISAIVFFILQIDALEGAKDWIYDLFEFENSIADNHAVMGIRDMFTIPSNDITFLIGDGIYENSDKTYYMHTDIGYMRHWYFGGVFFMVLPLLIMPLLYMKNKSKYYIYFLFPIALMIHFKGVFILNNPAFMPFLFLCSYGLSRMETISLKTKI